MRLKMQAVSCRMVGPLCCALVVCLCLSEGGSQEAGQERRDYYHVLGVPQSASDKEVKAAFRQLAVMLHPDKNKSADADDTFRELAAAYEVLSNRKKRERYDQLGHEAYLSEDEEDPEDEDESGILYFTLEELVQFMFQGDEEEEDDASLKGSGDEHHLGNMTGRSYWGNNIIVNWVEEEEEEDDEDGEEFGEKEVEEDHDNEKYQYWWTPPTQRDGD